MWNKIKSIFGESQKLDTSNNSSDQKDNNIAPSVEGLETVSSPYKMSLSAALAYLIKTYGITYLLGNNLVSFLNDLTDYEGNRSAKSLLREFVINQTLSEFITRLDKDSLERVRQRALIEYGFNERITEYVISSIAEATGISILVSTDTIIENKEPECVPSPSSQPPLNMSYKIQFMGLNIGEYINDFKKNTFI